MANLGWEAHLSGICDEYCPYCDEYKFTELKEDLEDDENDDLMVIDDEF